MVTDKIKQLNELKAKATALEQEVAAEQKKELAGVPAKYGFDSVESFITALRAAAGGKRGRPSGKGRKKRAVITDETRAQLKKLVKEGKTGGEIAKTLGISLPTVQNIKKALGLVQERK